MIPVLRRHVVYRCCALQLVPGKLASFERALQGLEQHDRKQLPVGEALQPDLAEQPGIFFVVGAAPFERKRKC